MSDARASWETLRHGLNAAAANTKDSQLVVLELSRQFASLTSGEKEEVAELLIEWVLSDDPNLRFDAMALIGDHGIRSAVPSLRKLAHRLEQASDPSTPYEWAKVNRLLRRLTDAAEP